MDFSLMLSSFAAVFNPFNMLYVLVGAFGGILIGCIPGVTATIKVHLVK